MEKIKSFGGFRRLCLRRAPETRMFAVGEHPCQHPHNLVNCPMLEYIIIALLLIMIVLLWLFRASGTNHSSDQLIQQVQSSERNLKAEFVQNRQETAQQASLLRDELNQQLDRFTRTFGEQLNQLTQANEQKLELVRQTLEQKLLRFQEQSDQHQNTNRQTLQTQLEQVKVSVNDALNDYKQRLRELFSDFLLQQQSQVQQQAKQISDLRLGLETSVKTMQDGNEKKLEEMRRTVDEKLHETLEKRLGESFKLVSDRLDAVHKGLGEMQSLAKDVGSLNKTMNNVKSRGILGEYQLQNILEDLLTLDQYARNVKTRPNSNALVEFAVKMPRGKDNQQPLWLPIDSKFPKEDYEALVEAYEQADLPRIDEYRKAFVRAIRKNAQDIREKYIEPPYTTEYGVMFLPYESLYAEVLRTPGLFDQLQKEYKITVAGPTTLSAFLNSLQMGFRTLAIEKRSSEVWDLLGAVKTEFGKFGEVLAKTKKKLEEATNVIDSAGVRSRAIERQLRHVQELPGEQSQRLIDTATSDADDSNPST